jgi:molybdopterin synthase sulfur carrier subunit
LVVIRLPGLLADQADGRNTFEVEARTVAEALRALPIADLIFDESGALRPLVNVYLDGADARRLGGLDAPVGANAEIRIVAAIAGG